MKFLNWYFSILLTALAFMALAQNPLGVPLVHVYNKAVFQGGSRTWDIKQDSRGIMYFANNDGLITFDGRYWKNYDLPNHTIVRSIYIDRNDRVYVGGQGEFGYFEESTEGGLTYVSLQGRVPPAQRKFADIWNTTAHGSAFFFRATNSIFEMEGDEIKVHPAATEWDFLGEAGGRLFAQDSKNGLLEFRNSQWISSISKDVLSGTKISSIMAVGKDSILISTINNTSYLLHHHTIQRLDNTPWQDRYTPSLSKVNDQEYVVATATEGCIIRDFEGRVLQRIGIVEGLPNKNVSTVFVDRQKNIWAAVDNAIAVISYGSAVRYFRPNADNDVTGYSTRVFQDKLYVSSSNGVYMTDLNPGIKDHSLSNGRFSLVTGSDRGEARGLAEVNGQLLLAHNRGLFAIQGQTVTPISQGTGSWLFLPRSSVYPIRHTLVGTYHGIDLLEYSGGQFQSKGTLAGQSDSYRFLEQDSHGDVWASHPYRGIYRLDLASDNRSYKALLFTDQDGLPSAFQNYVFKVKSKVVFATESGIYEFDAATKRSFLRYFSPYSEECRSDI